ncbi:hypothetical protein HD806DRAFT_544083 [Xylariaceae sp. AK1471]|nr:hypothetical protein HD806DRAFT_544083 [Xylariaceae sp. AK1471]
MQIVWGPTGGEQSFDKSIDRRFPSWSWVGWAGPVEYRLFAEMHPDELISKSLIDQFTINLDGQDLTTIPGRKSPREHATTSEAITSIVASTVTNKADRAYPSPSLPNILRFRAPVVSLNTFTISMTREYISVLSQVHSHGQQAVRHILDRNEEKMIFVGVSCHDDMYIARKGPYRAERTVKLFDDEVYPAVGKGSGLVNVLALDLDVEHKFCERVTVVRIYAQAWDQAGPVVRMVRMA